MPLLTTTTLAVLYPFLIELAKKGADKIVETSSEKLTSGSISWLKSLFFKEIYPCNSIFFGFGFWMGADKLFYNIKYLYTEF